MISWHEAKKILAESNDGSAVIERTGPDGSTITFVQTMVAADAIRRAYEAGRASVPVPTPV